MISLTIASSLLFLILRGQQKHFQSITMNLSRSNHQEQKVDYTDNTTPFGGILRGELPALIFGETPSALAFEDKRPRAELHALVIPKKHIKSVRELTKKDVGLMEEIYDVATKLIQSRFPRAYKEEDYILCFHVPPFNSVDHLHLHVLAPASKMKWIYRYGKYLEGTIWCASGLKILQRLKAGKRAIP